VRKLVAYEHDRPAAYHSQTRVEFTPRFEHDAVFIDRAAS
jgi:hypothetical protein